MSSVSNDSRKKPNIFDKTKKNKIRSVAIIKFDSDVCVLGDWLTYIPSAMAYISWNVC